MSFETAVFETSAGSPNGLPASVLPEIVFSGRSNAGKSSMINRLLNRKALARTSSAPGKTATINFYHLGFCRFVDLPGYGFARVAPSEKERWSNLVEGYFLSERDFRLVIQIVDIRRMPSDEDWQMIDWLRSRNIPFIVVGSKLDKLNKTQQLAQIQNYEKLFPKNSEPPFLSFSSVNGQGADFLRKRILESCR